MSETLFKINEWLDYLFAYGPFWVYLAIFLACFIENLLPPFPGDSFVVAAGGLVAFDRLSLAVSSLVILAGGLASVMILYYLGRNQGREFFIRKDYKYLSAADIGKMEQSFGRWGALILIVSRFVVGARAVLALVAGMGKYPASRMFVFSAISYVIFCGLLMYLGIKLVENIDRIEGYFRTYDMIVWPIIVIVAVTWLIVKVTRVKRADAV
jgi:membrane protein DedA with SNARE-associated domain